MAATDATAVVRKYFATLDRLGQHPTSRLSSLASVTTSTELTAERAFLRAQHRRGERQVGNTRIAHLKVQSVNLDNSDPTAGRVPTVSIDVCWDVSKVDVVDRTGKSIVSPNRADSRWTRYDVANYHYRANPSNGWRVADAHDLKATPCAVS
ncbi:hypothetical protein [Nocardioides terrisoli]|uniref:hypothetical protein n=1 Tax=Nocardioides terrisoli TaxID=3388267 RepID=UPI00287BA0F2|nr:hypothetical protein [Nocardioides marmorisolisilvae]